MTSVFIGALDMCGERQDNTIFIRAFLAENIGYDSLLIALHQLMGADHIKFDMKYALLHSFLERFLSWYVYMHYAFSQTLLLLRNIHLILYFRCKNVEIECACIKAQEYLIKVKKKKN